MLAVSGHHTLITGHRLLGHTARYMYMPPHRPPLKQRVAEGNSQRASSNEEAQSVNRPRRPQNWQQPPRQGGKRDQEGSATSQPGLTPKNSARRTPQQTPSLEGLESPQQITAFVTQQKQTAFSLTRGHHPETGLTSFCASMDGLLSRLGLAINYIHLSAIITAAPQIWTEAHRSPRFEGYADVMERLQALYQRCLQSLQVMIADMGAREISNVLWSSATLGFNPDDAVPGTVHALTVRFLQFLHVPEKKQRPNAHDVANLMLALAKLGHPAATTQVVGDVCLHFGRLVTSPFAQQRPTAQAVANLMWALGTLKHTPPVDRLLDRLCEHMRILLHSHDQRSRPNAQNLANMLWALAELKHVPSNNVVTAMFDHLVDLCHTPGLQPDAQAISNCAKACAELGLDVKAACVEALLKHFLEMHMSGVNYQHCCNLAWSLAVMQCLDLNTFEALLDKLATQHKLSVQESTPQSTSAQLTTAGARQLYQALTWLGLPSGSKQTEAWSSSRLRLGAIAPEPAVSKLSTPGQTVMWAALAMYNVPYQGQMRCGVYRADALLSPHDSKAAKVILMVEQPKDFIKNVPNRVILGSAVFRNQLLSRYGTVITIPYNPRRSTAENMADDIRAAVEAKTGLPLDSFRS